MPCVRAFRAPFAPLAVEFADCLVFRCAANSAAIGLGVAPVGAMQTAAGVSLVESLVALALAVTVTAGVGPVLITASRTVDDARTRTTEMYVGAAKLEQLLGARLDGDTDSAGGADVLVTDRSTDLGVDPPGTTGNGLDVPGTDTLTTLVPGYLDYVDARGRWVGAGATPGATYLRQWRADDDPTSPGDVLALHVRVRRLSGASNPLDDGVWMSTMRVRVRR